VKSNTKKIIKSISRSLFKIFDKLLKLTFKQLDQVLETTEILDRNDAIADELTAR